VSGLTDTESCAIQMVADGAEFRAGSDLAVQDEAMNLGYGMALAIRDNPDAFMAWYTSIRPFPKGE
jgi:hypothetical protein